MTQLLSMMMMMTTTLLLLYCCVVVLLCCCLIWAYLFWQAIYMYIYITNTKISGFYFILFYLLMFVEGVVYIALVWYSVMIPHIFEFNFVMNVDHSMFPPRMIAPNRMLVSMNASLLSFASIVQV